MENFYSGRKVLLTGHTGFKGAWLGQFLEVLGAETLGISLEPEANSLAAMGVSLPDSHSIYLDICNNHELARHVEDFAPETIFHLAAQPLVRRSYKNPVETFRTNVMGTVNLLELCRKLSSVKQIIVVTTDKVYKNVEKEVGYSEEDCLEGKDPYSASKVGTEMVASAWRTLNSLEEGPQIFSVRAGNVIGGGDHAEDRLLPDLIRGFRKGVSVGIRNPSSLRPWQHVLDPLYGYLLLASKSESYDLAPQYNFGPSEESKLKVSDIARFSSQYWGKSAQWHEEFESNPFPESKLLWLESKKAMNDLSWRTRLPAIEAVKWTIDWEKEISKREPKSVVLSQINRYLETS